MRRSPYWVPATAWLMVLLGSPCVAQTALSLDTIRAGRFDYGKMWTFEAPPARYFTDTYGFDASPAWFERARGAALRIPGCSASFVSPHGLAVTNHHCVRGSLSQISRVGENLDDDGFYARTLAEERRIPNLAVDQLVAVEDVSTEILAAVDRATTEAGRRAARDQAMAGARDRIARTHPEQGVIVQVVPLYDGGRFSAYTFRRYDDVRMVAAPENQLAFFGGDPDNFTYPRYDLDFAFFRVYGPNGQPIENAEYFTWSERGANEGDAVFIIGNPGPTDRLNTVAQLEFRRDVLLPAQSRALDARIQALWDFYREDPRTADALDVRNDAYSLSNTWKQLVGQVDALSDATILARKRDAERQLRDSIAARPALRDTYGALIDRIAALQPRNRALGPFFQAFTLWRSPDFESALIRRAAVADQLAAVQARARAPGAADTVALLTRQLQSIGDLPAGLERRFLVARLQDFATLPAGDELRQAALQGATPEAAAARLLAMSALASARTAAEAAARGIDRNDPAVRIAAIAIPRVRANALELQQVGAQEADLQAQLGRARFEIYGTSIPPEGSSSPRITDGIVQSYEYNGTIAPTHTTFYGMYDRYHSTNAAFDWDLPKEWVPPPPGLDLSTPLNFISTADTYGGNSGSPAVTKDLALVGLNFDRNMAGLSRNFIFLPERGRNVMVDVRAIREALDDIYDADRIVLEVLTHKLYESEEAADAAAIQGAPPR